MENIWTQHLKRPEAQGRSRHASFTTMLHTLAKETGISEDPSKNKVIVSSNSRPVKDIADELNDSNTTQDMKIESTSNEAIEIAKWTAKSQKGYEVNSDEYGDDYVLLLKYQNGQFVMKYSVIGDDIFEMKVASEEEAAIVIAEDNATTSQLYPDNPELQWSKNKTILI